MKLLGWMHRKLRQSGDEPFKDFVVGFPCNCLTGQPAIDDQQSYVRPSYGARPYFVHAWKDGLSHIPDVESDGDEENYQEDSVAAAAELFHGFLTIGTLGSDAEPLTPTFPFSVDYIAEKQTEVTENELKLINNELEKVLVAEAKEEFGEDNSSGRTSYVSAARSSHCSSTITLGGKPILEAKEKTNCGRGGCDVCPLQEYLLSSAVELRDANAEPAKERRVSLGELFERTKMTEANYEPKSEREKRTAIMHIIRKIKNKMIHGGASGGCAPSAGATADAATAETKLRKIIQMFHRKVHPDSPRATRKEGGRYTNSDPGEKSHPEHRCKKRGANSRKSFRFLITSCLKSQAEPPEYDLEDGEDDSSGNRECWINTDADYLVLEL